MGDFHVYQSNIYFTQVWLLGALNNTGDVVWCWEAMKGGTTDEVFHFRSDVFCGIKELWLMKMLDLFTLYMHKKI